MLKDYVSFIGVGQCGGNIVRELELLYNSCFYINSSLDDLDTIDTDYDNKYCIENASGMAKDIAYAEQIITSNGNDDKIVDMIYKKNPNAKMYFFVCSSGGGTAHFTPYLISKFKEYFPDRIVNAIIVKPHQEEDMIMHYNTKIMLEKIKKLINNKILTNLQVLDNNSKEFGEKFCLNKEFAKMFDEILSFQNINYEGNLDEEEFKRMFSTEGCTVICNIDNGDIANSLDKFNETTIYSKFLKNPTTHGLILNKELNKSLNRSIIREVFGIPAVTHDTIWDEDHNIIVSTGMSFNDYWILESNKYYNDIMKQKKEIEDKIDINNDIESVEMDTSILNNIIKKADSNIQQRPDRRKKRSVGIRDSKFKL